jgi:hypothetical protein
MPGATVEIAGGVLVGELNVGNTDGNVVVVGVEALLFKGFPTGISQRWPGCPCGGFNPVVGAMLVEGFERGFTSGHINGAGKPLIGFLDTGVIVVTGLTIVDGCVDGMLINGAPTAISQRCPGLP